MLADAGPGCVLTAGGLAAGLGAACGVPVLAVDEPGLAAELAGLAAQDLDDGGRAAPLAAACPAYVIYTSGSTGTPKGVAGVDRDAEGSSGPARRGREPAGVDAGAVRAGCR